MGWPEQGGGAHSAERRGVARHCAGEVRSREIEEAAAVSRAAVAVARMATATASRCCVCGPSGDGDGEPLLLELRCRASPAPSELLLLALRGRRQPSGWDGGRTCVPRATSARSGRPLPPLDLACGRPVADAAAEVFPLPASCRTG